MGTSLQYLVDTTGTLKMEDIRNAGASLPASDRDIPSYNDGKSPVWYTCKIINQSNDDHFLINVANPTIDEISYYSPDANGAYHEITYGEFKPFSARKYAEPNYIFDLTAPRGDTTTIYIRIRSTDFYRLPIFIAKNENILDQVRTQDMILALYVGIMMVMLLYNLFIFLSVRDNSYLLYVSYIISVLLSQIGVFGIPFQYLWPDHPGFEIISLLIFPPFSGITGMAFMQHFLRTNEFIPRFNKISYFFYGLYAIALGMIFFGKYTESFQLTQLIALLVAIFMLVSAILVYRRKYRPAGFFLLAWSIFLVGIVLFVLSDTGVIPYNNFTFYIMPIGSALEVILLSFALADRINIYRKEKEQSQAAALHAAEENERIIREQNVVLEAKVNERTTELQEANQDLSKALKDLKDAETQLVESEKMASLGQLTAGIAHEINNPINFVTSNVRPLKRDVDILVDAMEKIEALGMADLSVAEKKEQIAAYKTEIDFDYLKTEIEYLLNGINEGSTRTSEIVKGLRIFSRLDEDDLKRADINEGLDSTIIIVNNLLNNKIEIIKEYGEIPLAECYPGKLNQVFLNMISNAIYAVKLKFGDAVGGHIIIKTYHKDNDLFISIRDNGTGMDENTQKKLYEPFFTTKDVGEGTGLGLSIAYNTIKKHNGQIHLNSKLGEGTEFVIQIPIVQHLS